MQPGCIQHSEIKFPFKLWILEMLVLPSQLPDVCHGFQSQVSTYHYCTRIFLRKRNWRPAAAEWVERWNHLR